MFNIGDIITGTLENCYGITNIKALLLVVKVHNGDRMKVCVIAHSYRNATNLYHSYDKGCYDVDNNCTSFEFITIEEYFEKYPDASRLSNADIEDMKDKYGVDFSWDNVCSTPKKPTKIYAEDTTEPYVLSDEQRESLIKEMTELLQKYDYSPTETGLNAILDEWVKNKGSLIRLFEKHPNYNGKFQIVFDVDYERTVDKHEVNNFISSLHNSQRVEDLMLEEAKISVFSYKEAKNIFRKYDKMQNICYGYSYIESINGLSSKEINTERDKWRDIVEIYEESEDCVRHNGEMYTEKSYERWCTFRNALDILDKYYSNLLDDRVAQRVNRYCPELKAVAGQKTSRVVNKLCKMFGVDKLPEYNKMFAQYSDAINPLTIKRHTILSVHPVDYYTMSFGNSWASCHTIDKKNKRGMDNAYHGQYSGGTESYMLDGTSMVFYTVDKSYNGNEYELQPKINRNMFHFGKDKLIQGRVYPQVNDDDGGIYTTIREIVQKIMSECLESENSWLNVKGTSECERNTTSKGVHYKDYLNYGACNVSYYRKEKDFTRIVIGHNPICPCCGMTHSDEECIECDDCHC